MMNVMSNAQSVNMTEVHTRTIELMRREEDWEVQVCANISKNVTAKEVVEITLNVIGNVKKTRLNLNGIIIMHCAWYLKEPGEKTGYVHRNEHKHHRRRRGTLACRRH